MRVKGWRDGREVSLDHLQVASTCHSLPAVTQSDRTAGFGMLRRKWAACWDASPFGIKIERWCFTRRGARMVARRLGLLGHEPGRYFVTTVEEAVALDRRVYEHMTNTHEVIRSRFELDLAKWEG